jgi:2-polyprenyl-3-methyl-5-hydroxy-6-metoxy-1,4-benzoquinol methylase/ribosomal protein S27E
MKVSDLRDPTLMQQYAELKAQDLARLMTRAAEFVPVACPACGHDQDEECFHKEGFRFASCPACTTLYINPRPSASLLTEHYQNSAANRCFVEQIFPTSEAARREKIFAPRAELLLDICRRHEVAGTVADVGAGYGTFCEVLMAQGGFDRVLAVELSPNAAKICRKRGIETIEAPIETAKIGGCDVITAFELIEHLFDPGNFLDGCRRALRPGGLLLLTTPNIHGFDLLVLGKASGNIAGPSHLNYFHEASLRSLVIRHGFEVIETQTPGRLDAEIVRNAALAGKIDLANQPFLQHVLLDAWDEMGAEFQDFLSGYGLSSHLWLVARRSMDDVS